MGFFPYQLTARRVAGAVSGRLSDWHGLVADSDRDLGMCVVLRACGVDIWDFDHLPQSQHSFQPFVTSQDISPILDLSQGFGRYFEARKAAGAQRISKLQSKARKFERVLGPLRFEIDCRDRRAFEQVIGWKREQCLRTGAPDFLSWGWTTDLLERVWAIDTPAFAGRLSVLWHDTHIVAAHYGMRSATVWHWWFPTYNKTYAEFSPGGILLLRLAEEAATTGVRHIDLGKGDDVYKQSFATGGIPLVEGSVQLPSLTRDWRRARIAGRELLQRSPTLNRAWTAVKSVRDRLSKQDGPGRSASP